MGNSFATPESMKNLPNQLNKDEYIQITTKDGSNFYVFSRTFMGKIKEGFKQDWSANNIALDSIGSLMGVGGNLSRINQDLNKQQNSWFYITTVPDPKADPIQSSVDATLLKMYIKLFQMDPIVKDNFKFDLNTSIFELKNLKSNNFGKSKTFNLKRLKQDLKTVNYS
jgi:hypothetical protein